MENQKEFNNEMLKRSEISFEITTDKNPSFSEMKKLISEKYKKSEDCIDVYNILGKFGSKTFLIKTYIYETPEKLIEIKNLTKTKKQRDSEKKAAEEKKKAESESVGASPTESSKEEKPKEALKEEKKEEVLKEEKLAKETATAEKPAEEKKEEEDKV